MKITETYTKIDDVHPGFQFSNAGQSGWSCVFWSDLLDDEAPHRELLERFAEKHPESGLVLPSYNRYEDFVSTTFMWNGIEVEVYYETTLSHLALWSVDQAAVSGARVALISA